MPVKTTSFSTSEQASSNKWIIHDHEAGYRLNGRYSEHAVIVTGSLDDGTGDGHFMLEVSYNATIPGSSITWIRAGSSLRADTLTALPKTSPIDGIRVTVTPGTSMPAGEQQLQLISKLANTL